MSQYSDFTKALYTEGQNSYYLSVPLLKSNTTLDLSVVKLFIQCCNSFNEESKSPLRLIKVFYWWAHLKQEKWPLLALSHLIVNNIIILTHKWQCLYSNKGFNTNECFIMYPNKPNIGQKFRKMLHCFPTANNFDLNSTQVCNTNLQ